MKKIFSIVLASVALTSCVDTVILPDNKTVDEDYWQNKSEVQAIVNAAYAQLSNEVAMRNLIVWGDYRSDELVYSSSLPQSSKFFNEVQQMYSMQIDTKNSFTVWTPFYSSINYCNLVLEKAGAVVSNDPEYDHEDYLVNVAQVKALRAFCYFTLVKVFHDVPVSTKVLMNASDQMNLPQSTPAEVLQFCIDDLLSVVNQAPVNNAFKTDKWMNRGLMNRDAINSLLADIYLWRASINRDAADYQACVDRCNMVIAAKKAAGPSDRYSLGFGNNNTVEKDYYLTEYNRYYEDVFYEGNSQESIFELQCNSSVVANTGLNQMYYCYNGAYANGYGYLKASQTFGKTGDIWSSDKDYRLFDFVEEGNSDKEQYAVRKFVGTTSAAGAAVGRINRGSFTQNWIYYRLTDIMLMKAEALVQLAMDKDDTEKEETLKQAYDLCVAVYDRALPDDYKSTGSSSVVPAFAKQKDAMEEYVLKERARELCFEGKRWYDLMRYNYRHTTQKADLTKHIWENSVPTSDEFISLTLSKYAAPGSMRSNVKEESKLYMPINQEELELNNALKQNPSYKATSKK